MSIMNIFTQDAFSVMRLTDALREISYVPSLIGQMNLFQTVSIDTLDIAIEKDKAQNGILIQASPRGGPGQTFGKGKRSMRTLRIPHFQVDDAINADEVQQVRAFGEEVAVERLQAKIAERAAEASQFFALTEEYHRINILKTGRLLDADGSTLFDYFTEFGETPAAAAQATSQATGAVPDCDVLVIGGGPGGYSAAFRAADLGQRVILVEREATLGGVCLNVGCIPSKALLHVAAVKEEAERLADHGVAFDTPIVDLDKLRRFKAGVVARLTDGLKGMARMRKVEMVRGTATFADANAVDVALPDGGGRRIVFARAIVAAGSVPVRLPFLPDDPRIVDSTGALELPFIPERMLVIGGGIIGLEMATVYSALGARVDVVEQFDRLLPDVDRDVVEIWRKRNAHRFDAMLLGARVESVVAEEDVLVVTTSGAEAGVRRYDLILQAAGRRPSAGELQLAAAGVTIDARGFIEVDAQMRTRNQNVFAVGDVTGNPMLAHKAVHQGHVAAEAASGLKSFMDEKVVPSVAYTDPEIAWVGVTEDAARAAGRAVEIGKFPWAASGRAIANGADYGLTKLVFDKETHRIIGGAIVGPSAGDMVGEICLAIEMGADAVDIGKTIHPHPTLGETIGMAAEVAEDVCTDLPPTRRRP